VGSHVPEDACERPNTERVVVRDREVVLPALGRGEADVAPRLARDTVPEDLERLRQLAPREVPRELHTEITSSRTKWSRMTFGA